MEVPLAGRMGFAPGNLADLIPEIVLCPSLHPKEKGFANAMCNFAKAKVAR